MQAVVQALGKHLHVDLCIKGTLKQGSWREAIGRPLGHWYFSISIFSFFFFYLFYLDFGQARTLVHNLLHQLVIRDAVALARERVRVVVVERKGKFDALPQKILM